MPGALDSYRARRDFTRTTEPSGGKLPRAKGRRFVIQKHAATRLHYDLRLEWNGVLRSWAVTNEPVRDPAVKRLAVEVEDHPLAYARFEGTIPKGQYGGGSVEIWDSGLWAPRDPARVDQDLAAGQLKFVLLGERMQGGFALIRLKPKPRERRRHWLLIKEDDAFAVRDGAAPEPPRRAGAAAAPFLPPQLCVTAAAPPSGPGWLHELKLDGYRVQLAVADGTATIRTRTGLDWTDRFPDIAGAARGMGDCVMDGEAVALDGNGLPDFALLQAVLSGGRRAPIVFFVFDLLRKAGRDLRPLPQRARKAMLREVLARHEGGDVLRYTEDFDAPGEAILRSACKLAMEGVVSKRADSPYTAGRSGAWVKAKCRGSDEVVIGGWSHDRGGTGLGALLAGAWREGVLVYLGRVGTGFGAAEARRLLALLRPLARATSPFSGRQPARTSDVTWVRPVHVAQVAFAGWTEEGLLRQASFIALRQDKPAQEVAMPDAGATRPRAAPAGRGRLTNPDRILWPAAEGEPAVTKATLAEAYLRLAPLLLPQVAGRPLSLVRTPDGIDGERFFQRHATSGMSPLLLPVRIPGEAKPFITIRDEGGLLALAQIAATELHPWGARADSPDVPDRLVFDLDPGPDVAFGTVRAAAMRLRDVLDGCGLVGFPRLSGGKGVHVVVALAQPRRGATAGWPEAKAFALDVCRVLEREDPARFTTRMSKRVREGRIFLDYLRNASGATAIAAWSPRARPGAPIARPLTWSMLARTTAADAFRLAGVIAGRLPRDPWAELAASARPLADAMKRLAAGRARR
jgi:bifunctional non-homologous end joining protein LigD